MSCAAEVTAILADWNRATLDAMTGPDVDRLEAQFREMLARRRLARLAATLGIDSSVIQ